MRTWIRGAAAALLASTVAAVAAAPASASQTQVAMFQDNARLLSDPVGTLARLRDLGVSQIRFFIRWQDVAPNATSRRRPKNFHAADPKSYPDATWATYDQVIRQAKDDGIGVDVDLGGGAPIWATGPGAPKDMLHFNWMPSASEYGAWVTAVATRYSGNYNPDTHKVDRGNAHDLPAVHFWSIWNEPDYGPTLAPQGVPGNLSIENSPRMYRALVDSAWTALHRTGHGSDTILFGELAARGYNRWGVFSGMKPGRFLRAMYCVDAQYRPLRSWAAFYRGCPTTAAGSARFRSQHPAMFQASGFADHPYSRWYPPNSEPDGDPDYSSLANLPAFTRLLDRLQRVYGSSKRFPIWNTEYGYITSPPKLPYSKGAYYVSQTTAALYLNWAEYISWRNPRIQSTMQYLLGDPKQAGPKNDYGGFASGLFAFNGKPKATYQAYQMPIFLPVTSSRRGRALEVWGCVRAAHFALIDAPSDPETVAIQFRPASGGPFTTVRIAAVSNQSGYFDTRVTFPGSGTVRLMWSYPHDDLQLTPGKTLYSRSVQIKLSH